MWQRGYSQSEQQQQQQQQQSKPAYYAYPANGHPSPPPSSSSYSPPQNMMSRRNPIEGPPGYQLRRRVTWRSSAYKIVAYLYVLGILYIVWLIRDLFWLPFSSSTPSNGNGNGNPNAHPPK
ncbi:hypothetical protein UA08_03042 [Talaromyces atroroseus]|uniref:Uncharacterized protein n=1 Tax=Talaromyces atroroseus TaxID=1441469 RepID=A0A225AU13_TALAT|nr:hypothetical protein UA08_03042 [Talaromyces atroroseus]OKL61854.1 hypothetical protein UA08_03042 [Talaromyces atroroseus]